jgi:hypothetical protein
MILISSKLIEKNPAQDKNHPNKNFVGNPNCDCEAVFEFAVKAGKNGFTV